MAIHAHNIVLNKNKSKIQNNCLRYLLTKKYNKIYISINIVKYKKINNTTE